MTSFLKSHPGRALEIGCGSGRLLLPLRNQGFEIEGLELSPEMKSMAVQRAGEMRIAVEIHAGDMSQWRAPHPYCAVLAPAFTLQLADDPAATLRHWHSWLLPGGGLYLTVFMPYGELIGELPENEWYPDHETVLPDGCRALLETRHHFEGDSLLLIREHRYRIQGREGVPYECRQIIRWAEPGQWREWLESAGFVVQSQFLDWNPRHTQLNPGPEDFEGIVTYLAERRH